jgi:hypothetical protein
MGSETIRAELTKLGVKVISADGGAHLILDHSTPVVSERRLAVRPVGAHSGHRTFLARRISRIALTKVVLPTPGPPMRMRARLASACRSAAVWLGASSLPVLAWHQATALSRSMAG